MICLVVPEEKYLKSYKEAYAEYTATGISTYGMTDADSVDIFEKYDNYRHERNLKPDRVGSHYYWLVDDERACFIGEIAIRHRLNDALAVRGGHIGYVVRCSKWGQGYGTLMLKLGLEKAKALGLDKVLITCDERNIASARVMEKNDCQYADTVDCDDGSRTRRYWKTL